MSSCNLTFDPLKSSDQELQKGMTKRSSTLFADQSLDPGRKHFSRRHISDYPPLGSQKEVYAARSTPVS